MAIVFTFHKDRANIVRILKDKDRFVADSFKELRQLDLCGEYLADENLLDDVIDELIDEETTHEKCFAALTFGTGIQYSTFSIASSALASGNKKASSEERYEEIIASCLEHLPDGAQKLQESYSASILSSYESDVDVTLACAYLPGRYIENIRKVFKKRNLSLFGVMSQATGFYNIMDIENKQLILETEAEFLAFNPFGMLVWPKPGVTILDREQILDFISEETAELYPINPEVMNLVVDNIFSHLNTSVECSTANPMDVIAAMGCIGTAKPEGRQNGEGRVGSGVTDGIRKLLEGIRAKRSRL